MSITLILGGMFSEKTTTLISYARRNIVAKKRVIMIKHACDKRYNDTEITSHNRESIAASFVVARLSDVPDDISDSDVILIDEGQFYPDLAKYANRWADRGIKVIISALNGTYDKRPFEQISLIIPYAEHIIRLSSVCSLCGNDAYFSHLNSDAEKDEEGRIIGGASLYQARCRKCWGTAVPHNPLAADIRDSWEHPKKTLFPIGPMVSQ